MPNTKPSTNKILIVILCVLAVVCIYLFVEKLSSSSNAKKVGSEFKDVGAFQQYWLDPYAYDPYFAKDIYIVPGQARLSHNVNTKDYDNSYLPYESSIPAIDVLRANTYNQKNQKYNQKYNQKQNPQNNSKILPPSYFTQVIRHNTTPYSSPVVVSR